ncbi:GlcG/HbpS family heme-binding protein [Oceanobacter mangrovi]|uniref:GlcG/HbpS family heme-binding protein n=1 Tax=Oceanobacter mangrovi TaxID=2862510 RepID=UPI001C8F1BCB|nr:heme-binding protein [Oceanobacter mangrovi]
MTLTSQQVRQLLDQAVASATQMELQVCVAVVDSGANPLGFLRMDEAFLGSSDVAQRKARTAVLFRCPTDAFGKVIEQEKLLGMSGSNQGLCAFGGGLPILHNGQLLGGIGISGATAEQDQQIAAAALATLFQRQ